MFEDMPFEELVERLRNGEAAGVTVVFRRFADRLIALAHSQLTPAVRGRVDAEDVTQSAFRSFCGRFAAGQFSADNWDALWAILVVLTVRKARRKARHEQAVKRDVRRETVPVDGESGWEAVAREPAPDEGAALGDLVATLLSRLDPADRPVLELRLQGHEVGEIASHTGRSERTVFRVLAELRQHLRALME